ncbi:MAG: hypothetical protein A2289_21090 [Deltaproteobacteria bacterium RIFOXYA12_FULL_58_15]|nr:MAG: hypothetical protein A2289_21090 [Deltaproteobacteria bacterium RIFOXYA12_FULL_58_15]OGR09239.1 MAG: hypothetical protein A2341_18265 [Deltaproteobacteria bacterium RIFOXYB12_FULL_58_9]
MAIELILNGEPTQLDAPGSARLLDVLREHGHTVGVKEGCGEGECGACTVLIDDVPACSCLMFAGQANGHRVDTIESLSQGEPHPLMDAIVDAAGVQCGFCTPGIVLSAKSLLDNNPKPTREEVQVALSGNLCRCTGYHRIIDAVQSVAKNSQAKTRRP